MRERGVRIVGPSLCHPPIPAEIPELLWGGRLEGVELLPHLACPTVQDTLTRAVNITIIPPTSSDGRTQATNLLYCIRPDMKVRYYADAEVWNWHEHIVQLLRTIHDEQDIAVEIHRVKDRFGPITDFPGEIKHTTEPDVYQRDLKNNSDLIENIDMTPSRAYKPNGELDIAGHVALVDDGVQWASTLHGDYHGYTRDARPYTAIDFLKDFADSPSNRLCVECLHESEGDENYCPNCGYQLP